MLVGHVEKKKPKVKKKFEDMQDKGGVKWKNTWKKQTYH